MNREELFKTLHGVFSGDPNKKSSTISEYETLKPEEGLKKAEKYLDSSQKGQDNCRSDWTYWMYEGDITLAKVLISVFKALKTGMTDFPPPPLKPGQAGFLMDKTHSMQVWAERLDIQDGM